MHYIQCYLRCWTAQLSLKHNKSQIADDILYTLHVASPPSTADPVIQIQFTDNTAFQIRLFGKTGLVGADVDNDVLQFMLLFL